MGQGLFKLGNNQNDSPDEDHPTYKSMIKMRNELGGWDRVKMIFGQDQYGQWSPELNRVKESVFLAFLVGAIGGGFGRSRIAYREFIVNNNATSFETPMAAHRALRNKMTQSFTNGAFRIGWRLAAFTGIYMFSSTCISVYRGKFGIIDQAGGAAIAGFIYKFRDGPKASFSGALIGAMLGLVAGTISVGTMKICGIDPEDVIELEYNKIHNRCETNIQKTRNYLNQNEDSFSMLDFHEKLHSTKLANLETIIEEKEEDEEESNNNNNSTQKLSNKLNNDKKETQTKPNSNIVHHQQQISTLNSNINNKTCKNELNNSLPNNNNNNNIEIQT